MFKTTKKIEEQLPALQKILNLENDPKWLTLRFAINISLSLPQKLDESASIDFTDGVQYKTDVITGKNKTDITGVQADYTDLIAIIVSNYHDCELNDVNSLEKLLERHCIRGFEYLSKSLNGSSSVFIWLKNEFNLGDRTDEK